ncbi:hypothetical protein B0H13DRAFT_1888084 [Mycena leptocephala]|nr:hypothetical protein B0H13DRAFT_1888084 [Mycena leptocephala]
MTNYSHLAPAATPAAAAGAGVPSSGMARVNDALAAFNTAVDTLTTNSTVLVTSSMSEMANTVDAVNTAADVVQHKQADLSAALRALFVVPVSPPAADNGQGGSQAPPASQFIRMAGPWTAGLLYGVIPNGPLTAVADNGGKWFAITRSKYIGLTQNSAISLNAVTGISTGLRREIQQPVRCAQPLQRGLHHGFFGGRPVNQ